MNTDSPRPNTLFTDSPEINGINEHPLLGEFTGWESGTGLDPSEVIISDDMQSEGKSLSQGWTIVEAYSIISKMVGQAPDSLARSYHRKLADCRKQLCIIDQHDRGDFQALLEIERLTSRIPENIWEKINPDKNDNSRSIEKIINAPDDALGDFIMWHGKATEERQLQAMNVFEKYKQEFGDRIKAAIESASLPLDWKQAEERLKNVNFAICDPLTMHVEAIGGYYMVGSRTVYIPYPIKHSEFRAIAYHELFHHLSGQTTVKEELEYEDYEEDPNIPTYVVNNYQRSGLTYPTGQKAPKWINEAITEQLSRILLSNEQNLDFSEASVAEFFANHDGVYTKERDALSIIAADLDLQDLLAAYFEDAIPSETTPPLSRTRNFWGQVIQRNGLDTIDLFNSVRCFDNFSHLQHFLQQYSELTGKGLPPGELPSIAASKERLAREHAMLRSIFGLVD